MSAPIHSIRDGVIPAIAPAQVTEAHRNIIRSAFDRCYSAGSVEHFAQLIADSEARAVAEAERRMDEEEFKPCSALCDQLRAEVERLDRVFTECKESRAFHVARAEKAEAELGQRKKEIETAWKPTLDDHASRALVAEAEVTKVRARLDWAYLNSEKFGALTWGIGKTLNDAIDAAMKEDAK